MSAFFSDHSLHGRGYEHVDVQVHGDLTFAGKCAHSEDESQGICHISEAGTSDDVLWFGFDCAHLWDFSPGMLRYDLSNSAVGRHMSDGAVYRDVN